MSFCGQCGANLPTGAGFCGECGRRTDEPFADPNIRAAQADAMTSVIAVAPAAFPPTQSAAYTPAPATAPSPTIDYQAEQPGQVGQPGSSGRGGLLIVLALLGLAAVAGGIYLVTKSDDSSTDGLGTTIAGATTVVVDGSTTATDPSTIPIDPVQAASEKLQLLVAQDRPTADTLVGSWIPQLSAKRVGLEADGIVYGPVEIVADHQPLRDTYGAILVDGGAFQFTTGGNPMTGWFLTIVPETFASKAEALQWCTDRSLGSDVCLAREFKPPTP
ncbi:MAG: zinc ribbon domain-containing protein [Ilumatobacteraceae bacterium]